MTTQPKSFRDGEPAPLEQGPTIQATSEATWPGKGEGVPIQIRNEGPFHIEPRFSCDSTLRIDSDEKRLRRIIREEIQAAIAQLKTS